MKRSKPLARTSRLARGARMKAVNRTRKAKELARTYGPPERREWIKSQPCFWCQRVPSQNAHVGGNGGMSRKGDASTIVPLCAECHPRYDQHKAPFDVSWMRERVRAFADIYELLWQDHLNATRTAA